MGKSILCLRLNHGREYFSKEVDKLCMHGGTKHQDTAPYTPHQNGVAMWMNHTIIKRAKSCSTNVGWIMDSE